MKKLLKNKVVVLVICVSVVSLAYFVAQKAINEYTFKTNRDIISEEDMTSDDSTVDLDDRGEKDVEENAQDNSGVLYEDEIDLVLEGTEENATDVSNDGADEGDTVKELNKIYVYITGEVNVPGVVILNKHSRIVDAINAAGGTTPKADISKVNLVYVLEDGMKINIPNSSDLRNNPDFEYITMSSGDGASDSGGSRTEAGTTDKNGSGSSSGKGGSGSDFSIGNSIVNINTASQTELESLPGIGPSLALKIINYRNENGKFSSIDQIKNVTGIGDAKFEKMKSLITL